MQLHTLKRTHKTKIAKRVGRGGKRGSFSGRGIKGQKARAGRRIRPEIRDLIMKIPKRRGYRHQNLPTAHIAIKASIIAKKFTTGETVTPKILVARGLIKRIHGKVPAVKILGAGELLKGIIIRDCSISRQS